MHLRVKNCPQVKHMPDSLKDQDKDDLVKLFWNINYLAVTYSRVSCLLTRLPKVANNSGHFFYNWSTLANLILNLWICSCRRAWDQRDHQTGPLFLSLPCCLLQWRNHSTCTQVILESACLLIGELPCFRSGPALFFLMCSFPGNCFKQREMINLRFVNHNCLSIFDMKCALYIC